MTSSSPPKPHWQALFSNRGFPFFFTAMFVSLFGTGMNFAGVTVYVLAKTHSTVQVSFTVILLTLPRLLVPPLGGVLTDGWDGRYLSITLDLGRAAIVISAALLAWRGRLDLWQLYGMVLLLGVGFAIYWSSSLALLQEVIPATQLVSANSAVLIAVQGGMLAAGGLVGFVYERTGLAGILAIDGATYVLSALCLYLLRRGYFPPQVAPSPALFGSAVFGACRAIGAVLTQSSILASVPNRLMGRTQSAFAFMATVLQVVMSFMLGWLAEHAGLQLAFLLLGAIYGAALVAALRVRTLGAVPATEPTAA